MPDENEDSPKSDWFQEAPLKVPRKNSNDFNPMWATRVT